MFMYTDLEELLRDIKQSKSSKKLDLSSRNINDFIAQQIAPSIKECTQLEELILDDNDITIEGIKAITESITSKNLKILSINDIYINDEGIQYIADLILKQKKLEVLEISKLNINEDEYLITSKGAKILAKSLKETPMLNTINLSSNSIKHDGLKAIIEAININNCVKELNMEYNDINDLSELIDVFKENCSLNILSLSGNNLGNKGAEIISTILKANNIKLTELSLIDCKIKDDGVKFLASVLKKDTNLNELYLDSNEISNKGAEHLASMLKTNKVLKKLNITSNQITDKGAEFFIKALKKGEISINSVELDFNEISDELLQNIRSAIETIRENLVEALEKQYKEKIFNIKRTIDQLGDYIAQEENLNKKIKSEDTSQLSTQVEFMGGYNPDSDYYTSDSEPE